MGYAGTGRTPFNADSPPATAARILTQPPDLSGLRGPLRALVGHSLEKEPENRPTSRELLDMLLATGSQRSPATTAALAHQPGLRAAARDARGRHRLRLRPAAHRPGRAGGGCPGRTTTRPPRATLIRSARPDTQSTEVHPAARRVPIPAQASPAPISPAGPSAVPASPPEPKRRWVFPLAVLLLVAVPIAGILTLRGLRLPGESVSGADATTAAPLAVTTKAGDALLIQDSLRGPPMWTATESDREQAGCYFSGGLIAGGSGAVPTGVTARTTASPPTNGSTSGCGCSASEVAPPSGSGSTSGPATT